MAPQLEWPQMKTLPSVRAWLRHGSTAKRIVEHTHTPGADLLCTITEENVLAQMNNLRKYPALAAALATKELTLHGWYSDIGNGRND